MAAGQILARRDPVYTRFISFNQTREISKL